MSARPFVGLAILLTVSVACAGDGFAPGLGFDHAIVTPACGPTDGPAVAFLLASHPLDPQSPAAPYIQITVWDAPAVVAGRTWRVGGSDGAASALLVRGENEYEAATVGQIGVGVIDTAATTHGSAVLWFPSIGMVSGDFHAPWSPPRYMCG